MTFGVHARRSALPPHSAGVRVEPLEIDAWARIGLVAMTVLVVVEASNGQVRPCRTALASSNPYHAAWMTGPANPEPVDSLLSSTRVRGLRSENSSAVQRRATTAALAHRNP
jgi:hypothetical protein